MTLHGYWRSGCSWRVRLALGLKSFALGKEIDFVPVHLVKDGGEQKTEAYSKLNPAQVSSFLCSWLERRALISSFTRQKPLGKS
jgi:cyanate permease